MTKVVGVPDQQEAEIRVAAANLNQNVEDEFLWLTCGTTMGKLHKNRFYCPGIHMECVEVEEGVIVTPKTFVKMGEKEKLKDWKTAVRVNGIPIRRYMESGHLDFYRHKETCTMRCLSRAATLPRPELTAIGSINERTFNALENESLRLNLQGQSVISKKLYGAISKSQKSRSIPVSLVAASMASGRSTPVPEATQTVFINTNQRSSFGIGKPAAQNTILHLNMNTGSVEENSGRRNVSSFLNTKTLDNGACEDGADENGEFEESPAEDLDLDELSMFEHCQDSQVFWRGILQVGLLDKVMQDITSAVQKLKLELVMSSVGREESSRLTRVIEQLGITKLIKGKVAKQRGEMQRQKDQLRQEMEELKKRVAEAELKQYELKRKSDCFDQLIEMSTKRPNISMASPAPSDWSEQSTVGEEIPESEHSESPSYSDERGVKSGKRSRKPAKTTRIPQEKGIDRDFEEQEADENENVAESNGGGELTILKRKNPKGDMLSRKKAKYSEDEDYAAGNDADDDDDD